MFLMASTSAENDPIIESTGHSDYKLTNESLIKAKRKSLIKAGNGVTEKAVTLTKHRLPMRMSLVERGNPKSSFNLLSIFRRHSPFNKILIKCKLQSSGVNRFQRTTYDIPDKSGNSHL